METLEKLVKDIMAVVSASILLHKPVQTSAHLLSLEQLENIQHTPQTHIVNLPLNHKSNRYLSFPAPQP